MWSRILSVSQQHAHHTTFSSPSGTISFQLSVSEPWNAEENGPSACAHGTLWETSMELLVAGPALAIVTIGRVDQKVEVLFLPLFFSLCLSVFQINIHESFRCKRKCPLNQLAKDHSRFSVTPSNVFPIFIMHVFFCLAQVMSSGKPEGFSGNLSFRSRVEALPDLFLHVAPLGRCPYKYP